MLHSLLCEGSSSPSACRPCALPLPLQGRLGDARTTEVQRAALEDSDRKDDTESTSSSNIITSCVCDCPEVRTARTDCLLDSVLCLM